MNQKNGGILVFPARALHRLDTGGLKPVEIKHVHPEYPTQEERAERLKDVRRTCAALVRAQRAKTERRQGRSA